MSNAIDILIEVPYLWLNDGYGQTGPLVIWQVKNFCERHGLEWGVVRVKSLMRNDDWKDRNKVISDHFVDRKTLPPAKLLLRYDYPESTKLSADKLVSYTMFESNRCPSGWVDILNAADLVMVPNTYLVDIFSADLEPDVKLQYLPLHGEYLKLYEEEELVGDLPEDFIFSFVGTVGMPLDRKGISELSYALEDSGLLDRAKLHIRSRSSGIKVKGVKVNVAPGRTADIVKFYLNSHCGAYPSHGEGYGLPQIETSLLGRPVIMAMNSAAIWSSTLMPWVKTLPCEARPALYKHASIGDAGDWGYCDTQDFIDTMETMVDEWYNNRDVYINSILYNHKHNKLRQELSYENIQRQLDANLLPLL